MSPDNYPQPPGVDLKRNAFWIALAGGIGVAATTVATQLLPNLDAASVGAVTVALWTGIRTGLLWMDEWGVGLPSWVRPLLRITLCLALVAALGCAATLTRHTDGSVTVRVEAQEEQMLEVFEMLLDQAWERYHEYRQRGERPPNNLLTEIEQYTAIVRELRDVWKN